MKKIAEKLANTCIVLAMTLVIVIGILVIWTDNEYILWFLLKVLGTLVLATVFFGLINVAYAPKD